ncbi:MAG: ArdC-like ssDNA-binding domain-containing protein [Acidimicrobiales bacterium]
MAGTRSTPEQRAARIEAAHQALTTGVGRIVTGEDWQRYLGFQARFTRYSAGNTFLLMTQAMHRGVEPQRFAGYRTWESVGRHVRRGEKGFTILAPVVRKVAPRDPALPPADPRMAEPEPETKVIRGFTTATVFDVSQTEGDPLPEPVHPRLLDGDGPEGAWAGLTRLVTASGFEVQLVGPSELPSTTNGQTDFTRHQVVVRSDLPPAQQVKTLAHELAHIRLGHEQVASGFSHRDAAEIEAESASYLVCTELGMAAGDYSFGYVASWSGGEVAKIQQAAERARRVAVTVIDELAPPASPAPTTPQPSLSRAAAELGADPMVAAANAVPTADGGDRLQIMMVR